LSERGRSYGIIPRGCETRRVPASSFRRFPLSRTLSTVQAVLLGVLLLAGVGLIGATVFAVASRKWFWSDALHIRAGFPNVQGVEIGTKVRIRGMDAGEVAGVEAPSSTDGQVLL